MVRRFLAILLLGLLMPHAGADEIPDGDRTLSPYFFVRGDGAIEQLPLKSTDVAIDIAGVIADVRLTQRYRNDGQTPIEAEYVFPGSTRAAVYGLTMTIGERRVVAEIREKGEARAEFQAARSAGKSAALLEQHRPNVFKMNVANIMPGDEIVVELRYTELIVPTGGVYEFVYPTVVGPRYASPAEQAAPTAAQDRWQSSPYLREAEEPVGEFKLRATLSSAIPLKRTASPSHQVSVTYPDARRAHIELVNAPGNGPNNDFILRYQLAGDAIEAGLMLYEEGDEKFFLAMIEPPRRVAPTLVPPRDYLFIVDVSGSMHGFPLEVSKVLMRKLLSGLQQQDTFNVLLFAGDSSVLSPSPISATPGNIERALDLVDTQSGGGGTNLLPALQRAFDMPGDIGRSRNVVIVTDGYVSVETEAFDLIRQQLGEANVYVFGIGPAVNRFLIEGMARIGRGEPFVATNEREAEARAGELRRYIESPVLTATKLSTQGFSIHDVEPSGLPDTLASRPVIVFGKWRGERTGTLRIEGVTGEGKFTHTIEVKRVRPSTANSALRYLWARSRIARLDDYQRVGADPARVAEITQLGLQYRLLTNYTSFIAVDHRVRNPNPGETPNVKQPLPLPEGVSDLAVSGELSTTPEPELFALLGIAGAVAAWARRRRRDARAT